MPSYTWFHLGTDGGVREGPILHPLTSPHTGAVRPPLARGVLTLHGHTRSSFGRFSPKPGWSSMKLMRLKPCVGGFEVRDETPVGNSSADGGGSPWYIGRLYRFLTLYFCGWRDA